MPLRHILLTLPIILASGAASAAQTCAPLTFAPGQDSVTVHDQTPPVLSLCYLFSAHAGQQADIRFSQGDNVALGVEAIAPDKTSRILGDFRKSMSFSTEDKDYKIYVGVSQTHSDAPTDFTLVVTLH